VHVLTPMREAPFGRIGDYQITRMLPGTDCVQDFEATHVLLPRIARLRVLDHGYAKRLMREACILEALRHPGVPRIYECGLLEDRRPWVALEMLDGPTLADAICDRPLLPADVLGMLRDLAEILHHAHLRGIVHCRLRPELIVRHTTGLCVTAWDGACTHDSAMPALETADMQMYLAPEIAHDGDVDARADVFSLGVIAYEALTLAPPTLPIMRRSPTLPRSLALLIDRMTSGSPLARPSAAEVRAEAIRLLEGTDNEVVEEIEVELTELTEDISRPSEPPPVPRARWTPADSYSPKPAFIDAPTNPMPIRRRS
jgi:serine/threonine protein kinase